MRHGKEGKKFGRLKGARASFLRNLSNDLVRTEHVETTEARAKEIRPIVERLVTHAKAQTRHIDLFVFRRSYGFACSR